MKKRNILSAALAGDVERMFPKALPSNNSFFAEPLPPEFGPSLAASVVAHNQFPKVVSHPGVYRDLVFMQTDYSELEARIVATALAERELLEGPPTEDELLARWEDELKGAPDTRSWLDELMTDVRLPSSLLAKANRPYLALDSLRALSLRKSLNKPDKLQVMFTDMEIDPAVLRDRFHMVLKKNRGEDNGDQKEGGQSGLRLSFLEGGVEGGCAASPQTTRVAAVADLDGQWKGPAAPRASAQDVPPEPDGEGSSPQSTHRP